MSIDNKRRNNKYPKQIIFGESSLDEDYIEGENRNTSQIMHFIEFNNYL